MANFTAGTSFQDGVTNDVTAEKLRDLVQNAVPTSNLALASTSGTISNFTSSTATLLGAITGSTNVINIGSGQIYKDASGNVGVGTASPSSRLSITTSSATMLSCDSTATDGGYITISRSGVSKGYVGIASPLIASSSSNDLGIRSDANLVFSSGGNTERLRIDSSGRVGIGTASPSDQLHINNSVAATIRLQSSSNTCFVEGNNSYLDLHGGSQAIRMVAGSTERLRIDSSGNVGVGTASPISNLDITGAQPTLAIKNNDYVGNAVGTVITIFPETASGDCAARLQVKNTGGATFGKLLLNPGGGDVGIGTTSPSAQLELSTDSAKKPSTNTWTIASDQRLKTNITNADNDRCYEIVKQVPLKRYTWRSEVYSEGQVKDRSKLGWIAQDVEAVFPKAVGTNRFAYNQVFEDVVTPELDSDGNAVLDENGVAKTKTEKRLVSEDVIEDCKDLNSDQIYAAMYGTIQKLIEKVEFLESKVATLEAA